jgi:hypothetical protein
MYYKYMGTKAFALICRILVAERFKRNLIESMGECVGNAPETEGIYVSFKMGLLGGEVS